MVAVVISKAGWPDGIAVFRRFSSANVIGIASDSPQCVSNAGGSITAGMVTGSGNIAGSIGDFDRTLGKIRLRNGGVAASVGFFRIVPVVV